MSKQNTTNEDLYIYKIEKNIPISFSRKPEFPLEIMEVGDSFLLDPKDAPRLRARFPKYLIKGKKFALRRNWNETGKYRCWRTE